MAMVAVLDVMKTPASQERLTEFEMVAENLTGAAANKRLFTLSAHYTRIIKATGMEIE